MAPLTVRLKLTIVHCILRRHYHLLQGVRHSKHFHNVAMVRLLKCCDSISVTRSSATSSCIVFFNNNEDLKRLLTSSRFLHMCDARSMSQPSAVHVILNLEFCFPLKEVTVRVVFPTVKTFYVITTRASQTCSSLLL